MQHRGKEHDRQTGAQVPAQLLMNCVSRKLLLLLNLRFLTCKMERLIVPTSWDHGEGDKDNACKVLSIVPDL